VGVVVFSSLCSSGQCSVSVGCSSSWCTRSMLIYLMVLDLGLVILVDVLVGVWVSM